MIFLSTYRNKRRWIAAAGMTIWLMSAYVWMLDEIPGTVCVSDGQPLNITEGLPVTSQIRSTDGIAVSAGMMTGGRYEVECKLFGLIPVKEVTVHIVEETEVIPCGIPFGIYIEMEGILVVELCDLEQNGISVETRGLHHSSEWSASNSQRRFTAGSSRKWRQCAAVDSGAWWRSLSM